MSSKTEILKTILDTRDVIISSVVNSLLEEGVQKNEIKKFEKTLTKTLYAQFDSMINRVDKNID